MDQTGVAWLNFDGINRSTVAIVVIVIIILVILLIVRAIMVRRKAAHASSVSPDSDDKLRHRRVKVHSENHHHNSSDPDQNPDHPAHLYKRYQAELPRASLQDSPQPQIPVAASAPVVNANPGIGTIINVPPMVSQQPVQNHVVHFQQGQVVESKNIINTQPPTCSGANCGDQLQANPHLVQAQQNIHNPSPEIPAYPQRQAAIRNARLAAQQQRRPVQQPTARSPQPKSAQALQRTQPSKPVQAQQVQNQSQPRSNYRLQRGREVVEAQE